MWADVFIIVVPNMWDLTEQQSLATLSTCTDMAIKKGPHGAGLAAIKPM